MKNTEISSKAASISIAAVITYQSILIILIFLRPDLDPTWHTISEWAIGPYGWLMSLAFLISAVSYGSLFIAIKSEVYGFFGKVGLAILLICFIGTIGVGLFTTDPMTNMDALSTTGTLHIIFGGTALMLLPFGALLINLSLAFKSKTLSFSKRILILTAGLPLFGLVSFMTYTAIYVVPLGPTAYGPGVNIGLPPRFAFFTYMLWVITLASQIIRLGNKKIESE